MRFSYEHREVELRMDNLRHKTCLAISMSGIPVVDLDQYGLLVKPADSITNLIAISSSVSRDSKFSGS